MFGRQMEGTQFTLHVQHLVYYSHSYMFTLPAVNLGALMLKALFEHWPSTHLSSDEEKKTSEKSECTEYSTLIFCPTLHGESKH